MSDVYDASLVRFLQPKLTRSPNCLLQSVTTTDHTSSFRLELHFKLTQLKRELDQGLVSLLWK